MRRAIASLPSFLATRTKGFPEKLPPVETKHAVIPGSRSECRQELSGCCSILKYPFFTKYLFEPFKHFGRSDVVKSANLSKIMRRKPDSLTQTKGGGVPIETH